MIENNNKNEHQGKENPSRSLALASGTTDYITQKCRRIATALYVLTDTFPSDEPLKKELRASALDILLSSTKSASFGNLAHHFSGVKDLLNLAYYANLITEKHSALLKKEITHLFDLLPKGKESARDISPQFFSVSSEGEDREENKEEDREEREGDRSEKIDTPLSLHSPKFHKGQNSEQDRPSFVKDTLEKATKEKKRKPSATPLKDIPHKATNGQRRREAIIGIIKSNGEVGIKDISSSVGGCSEKTLQRELIAMVSEGFLLKEGERRWSRYSLREAK